MDAYVDGMIAQRRHHLTDDLLCNLIRAEDDGDRLSADELRLTVAGLLLAVIDTTRNQVTASMQVLLDHTEQWALLVSTDSAAVLQSECTRGHPAVHSGASDRHHRLDRATRGVR